MTKGDKVLVILLRYFGGIPGLFALVAVFMPVPWMAATHRRRRFTPTASLWTTGGSSARRGSPQAST